MQANVRLIGLRLLVSGLLLGNLVNLARADTDPQEAAAEVDDLAPHKRRVLVERLLDDSRFGLNWARYWRDVIMYRRTEERALLAAFITAQGDVREDGEAALIMAQSGQPEEAVAEISRIFSGHSNSMCTVPRSSDRCLETRAMP